MIRNIRKAISVICVIAMLLSLCVVAFMGSTSATVSQADTTVDTWDTVLELDFNNEKGITSQAYTSGSTWTYADAGVEYGKAAQFTIDPGNGGSLQLGADNNQGKGGTPFSMENGKKYRVTFEYKFLAGATAKISTGTLGVRTLRGALNQPSGGGRSEIREQTFAMNEEIATKDADKWTLKTDSAWHKYDYTFTANFGANTSLLLGVWSGSSARSGKVMLDNVKVEVCTGSQLVDIDNEYLFDFKKGDIPYTVDEINAAKGTTDNNSKHFSYAGSDGRFTPSTTIDANGLNFRTTSSNSFTTPSQWGVYSNWISGSWNNNAFPYDTDAAEGGLLVFKEKTSYIITVKYKVTDMGGNSSVGLGISATASMHGGCTYEFATVTETALSDDWKYLTFSMDTSSWDALKGKYLILTARSSEENNACVLVESVAVKERRDVDAGVAVLETVVDGVSTYSFVTPGVATVLGTPANTNPDRGFAGWYKDGVKIEDPNTFVPGAGVNTVEAKWTSKFVRITYVVNGEVVSKNERIAVGEPLVKADRADSRLYFESWCDADNKEYKVAPDHDVTLYAKFTGTYIKFNHQGWNDCTYYSNGGNTIPAVEIIEDPNDPTNKIAKMHSGVNSRPNFMVTSDDHYGASSFKLELNTEYFWSVKVKTFDTTSDWDISWYCGDASVYKPGKTHRTYLNSDYKGTGSSSEWMIVSGTFKTGSSYYHDRTNWNLEDNLFLTFQGSTTTTANIYIDDLIVGKVVKEGPEGTSAISFKTNGPDVMTIFGYPGDKILLPEDPKAGGAKFVGWYTDKKLSNKFNNEFFGTENITLYAKWEATPFLVDFSGYAQGTKSARAKFVKDENGNDYLDWWTGHAPDNENYTDVSTHYRVFLNKDGVHFTVNDGTEYTIKFKYKLLEGSLSVRAVTNGKLNGWRNYKDQENKISLSNVDVNNWQEASVTFTASTKQAADSNYLSIGFAGGGHVLVDDIIIEGGSTTMNLYGSKRLVFMTNGGKGADSMSGDPGEAIGDLPKPKKAGYAFDKWYLDAELTTPFTATTYGEEDLVLYAGYHLGKFVENYEDFPNSILATGFSGAYKLYNTTNFKDFDKANVQKGSVSVYRNGATKGSKAFTLCRDDSLAMTVGKQYTVEFYVKPTNVTNAAGTIGVINMKNITTGINSPTSTNVITTVGELKAGEWQKVSYTFTAADKYIGLTSTEGNDLYFDNITVTLKGYSGTTTGDDSVNPVFIIMMVILAAGALTLTGKKVFDK